MYTYNVTQWLAFWILYSFLGWVWECAYVSVRKKKWVNRGFLYGPLLPIYGSGAVIVLFAALPFRGNVAAVFVAGMLSATVLEYGTGAAMEAIFKVRYWDYSDKPLNLHGHICLGCSLGWGFFSISMVYVLHEPFEHVVLSIPDTVLTPVLYGIMMLFSADFALSVKAAFEFREVLVRLERAKREVQLLQKRLEVYEAFFADNVMQRRERYEENLKELAEGIRKKTDIISENSEAELKELRDSLHEKKLALSAMGEETKERMVTQIQEEREELQKKLAGLRGKLAERAYMKRDFARIVRGNPSAVSRKYVLAFDELKSAMREKIDGAAEKKEAVKDWLNRKDS